MIRAVLFDLGDTLFHYERPSMTDLVRVGVRPMYERLGKQGYRLPAWNTYVRVMKSRFLWAYAWSRITRREVRLIEGIRGGNRRVGVNLDLSQQSELCYKVVFPTLSSFFVLAEHVTEVLRELRDAGYRLGIISNTLLPGPAVDSFLRDNDILDFFPVRVYSSEIGYMKPNARIFGPALEQLGVTAERTLFIGDHPVNDVKGPARVGMKTVLAVHGERIPRLPVRPDHIIRRLSELPGVLQSYCT